MNYTTNYHLPQWVESDRILMEDFNDAMETIDEGLTEAYRPDNLPFVIGSYYGTGEASSTTITLGFRPSLVIVSSPTNSGAFSRSIISDGTQKTDRLSFTDTGFIAHGTTDINGHNLNDTDKYAYIAFR